MPAKKVGNVQERRLKLLLNEHTNYLQLFKISEKPSVTVRRLRILGVEKKRFSDVFREYRNVTLD